MFLEGALTWNWLSIPVENHLVKVNSRKLDSLVYSLQIARSAISGKINEAMK